jgi:hypothetical protein
MARKNWQNYSRNTIQPLPLLNKNNTTITLLLSAYSIPPFHMSEFWFLIQNNTDQYIL